jgi:hypothetical protein
MHSYAMQNVRYLNIRKHTEKKYVYFSTTQPELSGQAA